MIKTETYTLNGRQFVKTYSDAGRYVVGGSPEGNYEEANDPAEFGRTYTEGDLMPAEDVAAQAQEIIDILLGGEGV